MTLSDVNLLIYAYNSGDKHHADAKKWFEAQFDETGNLCFSWLTISGFLRIITTDTLFGNGFSTIEAIDFVDEWTPKCKISCTHLKTLSDIQTTGQRQD